MAMEDEIKQLRGAVEDMNAQLSTALNQLTVVMTAFSERISTPAGEQAVQPPAAEETKAKPKTKAKSKAKAKEKAKPADNKVANIEDAKPKGPDVEEVRDQARTLLTVLIKANKRDVATSLIRRVAGDLKLPEIEKVETLEKLCILVTEFIEENDLEAAEG